MTSFQLSEQYWSRVKSLPCSKIYHIWNDDSDSDENEEEYEKNVNILTNEQEGILTTEEETTQLYTFFDMFYSSDDVSSMFTYFYEYVTEKSNFLNNYR